MPASSPEQLHSLLAAAFNGREVEAFVDLYEPEAALVVPPQGLTVRGTEAIRAAIEPVFEASPAFENRVVARLESGDLALTHVRWRSRLGADDDGEESGLGTVVSRRQSDGSWRIALDVPVSPE